VNKKKNISGKQVVTLEKIEELKAEIQKQLAFYRGKVQQLIGGLGTCNVILSEAKLEEASKTKNG